MQHTPASTNVVEEVVCFRRTGMPGMGACALERAGPLMDHYQGRTVDDMVAPVLIVGFVLGFVKRGWLVVPAAAAVLPTVLLLAGAFDDGEGVGTMLLLGLVFAGYAAAGLLGSFGFQRIAGQPRSDRA